MSVTTAGGAVSTQHQATQEQIRLAKLIEDKKHDQPEVQEIVRKVLDIVVDSNQDDALLALYDCDYDYEKAVSLLIEKGHEVANEWRTATNHKLTKKQQQKVATTNNGHRDLDENGQQQRGNGFTSRGRSRRFQQNGGDSHNANNQHQQQQQENDNYVPQQRQRGGSGYRGRNRGYNRGGYRGTDRNHQQQIQDSNVDPSSLSDTNRRHRGAAVASEQQQQQQQQDSWDVGNWNGETLIYSRTAKDDEQILNSDDSSRDLNGQSDLNTQQKSTPEFDPIEAARQIKSVIGIGQTSKSSISDQQQKSKPTGQMLNTKVTPSPPQPRIPQQPVIFTDHFDGGVNKIDVQFGNLDEPSSSSAFYSQSESIPSNKTSQRTTGQSAHISPSIRPTDQPVMNAQQQQQQRILPNQIPSQPSMTIKPVVTPQYAVHQQQQQINPSNVILQSLFYHHHQQQQQQPEPVTLDTSYDPTFSLPSMDFNSPYFMAAPPQPQTQPRYLVSQAPPSHSQPTASKNAQTPSGSTSTTTKKAPAVPPGMFPPTAPPLLPQQPAYSATYGIQQQTGGTTYSTPYDTEHLFNNTFMPLTNVQQTQSPTGAYGSVTPPNQQQQTNNNNENKTMNYRLPLADNLILLQQYQQYALQQSNSQQQGQQPTTHSPGTLNYFLGHPPSGASYSPGHQIMYAQAATAMAQQQAPKQQGQQYNQNNSSTSIGSNDDYYSRGSSSNKEGQYMYAAANQPHHVPPQSAGQQQGVNKQQQQRPSGNVYNNHQGQQRPFQ